MEGSAVSNNDRSVKIYTVIDGKPSEIGQCHAGLARLMRKKGLAEWRDGKLWLLAPAAPAPTSTVRVRVPDDVDPEDILDALFADALGERHVPRPDAVFVQMKRDVPPQDPEKVVRRVAHRTDPEYLQAILEEAGVDLDEWPVTGPEYGDYADVPVSGGPALAYEFRRRLGLGHETCSYSNPKSRTLGFLDYTAREYVYSPLTAIKEKRMGAEDVEPLGVTLAEYDELICSEEGRTRLFGHGGFGDPTAAPPEEAVDWGPTPPDVADVFFPTVPVGLLRVASPVRLPPLKAEEDAQERIDRIVAERRAAFHFDLVPVPGWTYFAVSGAAHDVIPILDEGGQRYPAPSETPVYGLYRREMGRVFRVWAQGRDAGWDESVKDGPVYRLSVEHALPGVPASERVKESVALAEARIRDLRADADTSHELSGWTAFHIDKSHLPPVFSLEFPPEVLEEMKDDPKWSAPRVLSDEESKELFAKLVRVPYPDPHADAYAASFGVFRVVGNRLFRVWNENGRCSWDESVRASDGTYDVKRYGRSIDKLWGAESNRVELLSPSGFPENVRDAERRISEYLASPDAEWVETRHGGYKG
jgi:hypothetical protein